MKREEFVFTIGYQGNTAIVDGSAMKKFKNLSTVELAEKGLLKAAFNSAVYSKNEEEIKEFLAIYNKKSGSNYSSMEALKRLFGGVDVQSKIERVKVI